MWQNIKFMLLGSGLTICIGMAIVIAILRKQIVKKNTEIDKLNRTIEDYQNQLKLAETNKNLELEELKSKIAYLEKVQLEDVNKQAEEVKKSDTPIEDINSLIGQFNAANT